MKSHVRDLLRLAESIYRDAAAKCTEDTLDERDLLTLKSRLEHEGLSFLTITLPAFGKDFDRSLSECQIASSRFKGFAKRSKAPAFLQGFFKLVFDESGRINDKPCVGAIEGVRQIAYTFKKLLVDCDPIRVRKTLERFVSDELFVRGFELGEVDRDYFNRVSRCLWNDMFDGLYFSLYEQIIPKHGPGATADKLSGNAKFCLTRWHERLEPYFPMLHNAFPNENATEAPEFEELTLVPLDGEQPVKVTPVPKTLRGPRIIAIEPACMQYAQQGLAKYVISALSRNRLTSGHINFKDQEINRKLALRSSKDERFATLDLSSASDLVPYQAAISMFDSCPDLRDAISACRSRKAQMPDGSIIDLSKFASMGSALCFPVEAMYFYTICVAALLWKRKLPVSWLNIYKVSRDVYIYGDDIIVPTDDSDIVIDYLHKYCCKVNVDKSFRSGKFRESCGMDAYDGEEVTPTYIRRLRPNDKRDANGIISWVAASNQFHKRGYWKTADLINKMISPLTGRLPVVTRVSSAIGLTADFQRQCSVERWNKKLQRFEVKAFVATPVYNRDPLDGWPALLKFFVLSGSPELKGDEKHLERSARHGAVALQRRWVTPY